MTAGLDDMTGEHCKRRAVVDLMNPGIISLPLGFVAGVLGTLLGGQEARSGTRHDDLRLRGFGAKKSEGAH